MRILIAPDAYKESMSATQAAEAIARGARRAAERDGKPIDLDLCPMTDGGAGFVDLFPVVGERDFRTATVVGPLGEPVEARFALGMVQARSSREDDDEEGEGEPGAEDLVYTAIIEMSSAAGLALVPPDRRDPERTTTFGVGQLILRAADAGAERVLVGLGNSATCDGGAGAAAALGVKFRDEFNNLIERPTGGDLLRIVDVDISFADPRVRRLDLGALCDVDSPMLGPEGTAPVFAPQKGADDSAAIRLASGLEHYAKVIRKRLKWGTDPYEEWTGAAGGLAWGLTQRWCDGSWNDLTTQTLLKALGFAERAARADLVITGCGRVDETDLWGKAVGAVAECAQGVGAPVLVLVGAPSEVTLRFFKSTAEQRVITPPGMARAKALALGPALLEAAAEIAVAERLAGAGP